MDEEEFEVASAGAIAAVAWDSCAETLFWCSRAWSRWTMGDAGGEAATLLSSLSLSLSLTEYVDCDVDGLRFRSADPRCSKFLAPDTSFSWITTKSCFVSPA